MSLAIRSAKIAAISTFVLMYGCASVNKAPATADAESKLFKAKPDVSQVYVYRNEMLGAAISMTVSVDGKVAGTTGAKSFFKFDLPPGAHKIASQGKESELTLNTEAGKMYYVWQEVKMGAFSAGSKLQLVSEDVGKKGVAESNQIQSAF